MKLSKIILEQNCGCGKTPCETYGINEELCVAKRKLEKMLAHTDADFIVDAIMSIQDENVLDTIVAALENPDQYRMEEENRYNEDGYDEGDIKLMGDMILPTGKMVVLQAEENKYNRGLLVTSNEDRSYDVAYWADDKTKPYPIGIEIDGKEVAKDANIIKFLFHPEMK